MLIAIDSSSDLPSVAVGGEVIHSRVSTVVRNSECVLRLLEELKNDHSSLFTSISGVAVNIGPGSYTGTRIGLALAQGIALAYEVPLYCVSSFLQKLFSDPVLAGEQLVHIPARKGESFSSKFLLQPSDSGFNISELCNIETVLLHSEQTGTAVGLIRAAAMITSFEPFGQSASQYLRVAPTDPVEPLYCKPVQAKTLAERGLLQQGVEL